MGYPGAKDHDGVWRRLLSLMPPHRVYVEAFLGGGSLLWRKRAAQVSIAIERDADVAARFVLAHAGVASECIVGDALQVLPSLPVQADWLVYCDPPYIVPAPRGRRLYRCQFSLEDHARLLDVVRALPCLVMVAGYPTEMYQRALDDWHCEAYPVQTRGGPRIECCWCNFPPPDRLHDYSQVGSDFRARERIRRVQRRLLARIERMAPLERRALFSLLATRIAEDSEPAGE